MEILGIASPVATAGNTPPFDRRGVLPAVLPTDTTVVPLPPPAPGDTTTLVVAVHELTTAIVTDRAERTATMELLRHMSAALADHQADIQTIDHVALGSFFAQLAGFVGAPLPGPLSRAGTKFADPAAVESGDDRVRTLTGVGPGGLRCVATITTRGRRCVAADDGVGADRPR